MCSYIVRIYRRDLATGEIRGIVETPESRRHALFTSFAELQTILTDVTFRQFSAYGMSNERTID